MKIKIAYSKIKALRGGRYGFVEVPELEAKNLDKNILGGVPFPPTKTT